MCDHYSFKPVPAFKDLKPQLPKYMFSTNIIINPRDIKLRLYKAMWLKTT